jgi:hypothetical protein
MDANQVKSMLLDVFDRFPFMPVSGFLHKFRKGQVEILR